MLRSVLLVCFLGSMLGCAPAPLVPYDRNGFVIRSDSTVTIKAVLVTGRIKEGHSDWILATDYADGIRPVYYCYANMPHQHNGVHWIFDAEDEKVFVNDLNAVLESNNIYSSNSTNAVVVNFLSVEQGPDDHAVYNFDVELVHLVNGEVKRRARHQVVGNDEWEEFWSPDGWGGAKARARNRLMKIVIGEINGWLSGEGEAEPSTSF